MKKKLALMLAVSMTVGGVLTGCGSASNDAGPAAADAAEDAGAGEDAAAAEADSADAAEADGAEDAGAADASGDANLVYAVEAGSAGEAAAEENGFQTNVVASQADALMEVASGTSDAAIIDLLMAGAMIGEGTSYPNLIHTTELTTEEYGVGCRKGSDLASFINSVFGESYADGTMEETAAVYGV